jgi:UDP-N-acetylenolpyruvoylglucosamine reductase
MEFQRGQGDTKLILSSTVRKKHGTESGKNEKIRKNKTNKKQKNRTRTINCGSFVKLCLWVDF